MKPFHDIKTIDEAFAKTKFPRHLDVYNLPESFRDVFTAFYELSVVIHVLNEEWIPDTDKLTTMDEKHIVVIEMYHEEMQYHGTHVAKSILDLSHSRVFAFRSLEVIEHFKNHFLYLYKNFMLTPINKVV